MSHEWTPGEYEEYHESKESLMDDGKDRTVIVNCAICGDPVVEEDGHTHDDIDGVICDDCYDTLNEEEAEDEEDDVAGDGEEDQ